MKMVIGPVTRTLQPGEVKEGRYTTEWWLTKAAFMVSLLAIIAGFLAECFGWGNGDGTTIGVIMVALGFASTMLTKFGYHGFRVVTNLQAGNQLAHVEAAKAMQPKVLYPGDVGPAGDDGTPDPA